MDDRADNHALLNALKHPLRRQILRTMSSGETASPRELAERLEQPLGNLSYHVRVLAKYGALELVGEKQVRGTMQHFYRPAIDAEWVYSLLKEPDRGSPDGAS
jgi:DNA-binding transcriptional ArsR family regulator